MIDRLLFVFIHPIIHENDSPGGAIQLVVSSDVTTKHEHARVRVPVNIFILIQPLDKRVMIVFNYRNSIRLL